MIERDKYLNETRFHVDWSGLIPASVGMIPINLEYSHEAYIGNNSIISPSMQSYLKTAT